MRIRQHLTYANVMATIAVFGVVAGGGAYAASKIDTPDIANKAITAKKLDGQAVKTAKLRSGAVTGDKMADGAVETRNLSKTATLPMAGVFVSHNVIRGWFNRFNDEMPTLEHTRLGVYDLRIPGIDGGRFSPHNLLSSASLMGVAGPQAGEISTRWTEFSDGSGLHPIISTYDSSGNPTDQAFTYIVNYADHAEL
jgi:hypothetical protein